ncbi:hypothetical protein KKH27_03530 [bacterium]|nr:hypothetical protein [bacterium]MBU1984027.1 hypothetical protein [bacterium]
MRAILAVLAIGMALTMSSCIVWIAAPVASYDPHSWVMIESNTEWEGEIDGRPIRGYGDRVYYMNAECASIENVTCRGYIRLTVSHCGECAVTSYSNAAYGSVWVCD